MLTLVDRIPELRNDLEEAADPTKVDAMFAYMKGRSPFLGVTSPIRKMVTRPVLSAVRTASEDELLDFAEACWEEPEREFRYVATDALRRGVRKLSDISLPRVRHLVQTDSWWDTVDALAVNTIGPMVTNHPELAEEMDRWINDDDFWIVRTAILHQLMYKERTDAARLFSYAQIRAADQEFFIRKAIGWSLRQYARIEPEAVQSFVQEHDGELSGLTKREALKHLS